MHTLRNRWFGWATGAVVAASFVPWSREHVAAFAVGSFVFVIAVGAAELIVQRLQRRSHVEYVEKPETHPLNGEVPQWGSSMARPRDNETQV